MTNEVLIYFTIQSFYLYGTLCNILIVLLILGILSIYGLQLPSTIPGQASAMKPVRVDRERGPLLPFDDLVNDNTSNTCNQERDRNNVASCDFGLPNPRSLMHVTSRKKAPAKKKSLPMVGFMFDTLSTIPCKTLVGMHVIVLLAGRC